MSDDLPCEACERALLDVNYGIFYSNCQGCRARLIYLGPEYARCEARRIMSGELLNELADIDRDHVKALKIVRRWARQPPDPVAQMVTSPRGRDPGLPD